MDATAVPIAAGGAIAGAIIAQVVTQLLKVFAAWKGWKLESTRTTQDELHKICDTLRSDMAKIEKRNDRLEAANAAAVERESVCMQRIARLEATIDFLVEKIKLTEPGFKVPKDRSDYHTPLPSDKG